MQPKTWTLIDKTSWGGGPWQTETDKEQWTTPTGTRCLIVRQARSGCWRGYVAVTRGHPWFGKPADDIGWFIDRELTWAQPDDGDVYGGNLDGATAQLDDGDPRPLWWVGFHTDHLLDIAPAGEARERAAGYPPMERLPGEAYRRTAYVRGVTETLAAAADLAAVQLTSDPGPDRR